jgi:hypothetical protein
LLCLFAATLLVLTNARATDASEAPAGTLQGTVTTIDSQGQRVPVAGAHVVADSVLKETTGVGDTDAAGHYGPFTLFPFTYTVTVTAPGFEPASATVGVVEGGNAVLDFTLTPIAASPTPTATPAPARRSSAVRHLATTGAGLDWLPVLFGSLGLIGFGLTLLVIAPRRRAR